MRLLPVLLILALPVLATAQARVQPARPAAAGKGPYVVTSRTAVKAGVLPHYIRSGSDGRVGGVEASKRVDVEVSDQSGKLLFSQRIKGLTGNDVSSAASNEAGDHLALKIGSRLTIFRKTGAGLSEQTALGSRHHNILRGLNGRERVGDYNWSPDGKSLIVSYLDQSKGGDGQVVDYKIYDAKTDSMRDLVSVKQGTLGTSPGLFSPNSKLVGLVDDLGNHLDVYNVETGAKVKSHQLVDRKDLGFNIAGTDRSRFSIDDGGGLIKK